jgi:hypothetical protein
MRRTLERFQKAVLAFMLYPELRCPFCKGLVPNVDLKSHGPLVVCPTCSRKLQYSRTQLRLSGLIALVLIPGLCVLFGLRDIVLLIFMSILLWFPVCVALQFFLVWTVPTRLEAYKGPGDAELFPRDGGV